MAESTAPVDQGPTPDTIDIREVRLQPQNIWRVGWVVIALLAITLMLELRHRRWWLGHLHSPDGMVCVDRDGTGGEAPGEPHAPWIRHDSCLALPSLSSSSSSSSCLVELFH